MVKLIFTSWQDAGNTHTWEGRLKGKQIENIEAVRPSTSKAS